MCGCVYKVEGAESCGAICSWEADSRGETVSHGCRCAERRACATVTVETVRWSSWRSLRAARRESPAPQVATRGSDASVTCNVNWCYWCVKVCLLVLKKMSCKHARWPCSSWLSEDLWLNFLCMSWTASSLECAQEEMDYKPVTALSSCTGVNSTVMWYYVCTCL